MNDLDLHTWTVSTSVGTVFSGPVLVEPQTLGVHVSPAVQSVLVAAPIYNCNVNIAVTCLATLGLLRSATENSKIIFDLHRDATQNNEMIFGRFRDATENSKLIQVRSTLSM